MNIDELCQADLMHYKREQRKYFHTQYERRNRASPQSYSYFLKHNYEKLKPVFDQQFMAKHRLARDYLATVTPQ